MTRLLLLADSLAFHGPSEVVAPSDPRLYPQVAGQSLGMAVDLAARPGWTARDAWWSITKDPVVWGEYLPRASVVVLGVGQMDQLPAALPTWLRESIPYVRSGDVRRRLRKAVVAASPHIIRATDGRMRQLPQSVTDRYLTRIVDGIRYLRPGLPVVLLGPAPWTGPIYPSQRPHTAAVEAGRRWALRHDVAFIEMDPIVGPRLATCNPDGMHWSWEVHRLVGEAIATVVRRVSPLS